MFLKHRGGVGEIAKRCHAVVNVGAYQPKPTSAGHWRLRPPPIAKNAIVSLPRLGGGGFARLDQLPIAGHLLDGVGKTPTSNPDCPALA